MENSTQKYSVSVKKLPKSKVEITAAIPAADFDATRSVAVKHIGKDAELPGFRKGHVPEKMLVSRIGEAAILEEMAEVSIAKAYPEILIGEKIDALGRPEVKITKVAPGNPLEFVITTAVFPEVTLPDHKKIAGKIAGKKDEIKVTDEEVENTLTQIRKMRAEGMAKKAGIEFDEKAELPALDDEFVKTLGTFDSVKAFTDELRINISKEKEREARDKKRVAIMEALVADATIELPEIIVEQELHRMQDEFAHEIERMGMTFDAYTKAVGKSKEDMEKEWLPDAEKRAKTQLITSKIAEVESITPDKETMEREAAALRSQYPDASEDRIYSYIEMLLTNEKVFQFLETQGS